MTPEGDKHIAVIAAAPPIVLVASCIETILNPSQGESFVLLFFVLASPFLVAWLIARLQRTDA